MLQRGIDGSGGYSAGDPWADSGSTDDTASTTSLPSGIQDSGPTWEEEDTGGFGGGTSRNGDTATDYDPPSFDNFEQIRDRLEGSDDSTDSTDSDGGTEQDVDDIQNAGDSTDGGNNGFGDGTSRSGDNSGSGGNSGPGVEDSRGSDDVSPDVPPDEVEAPGDHAPEPDNEPADNTSDDAAGLGTAGKAGVALLVIAVVMEGS